MTLPTRYTINGVPWGDCACCDMAKCVWHTEHPDRDPPSRPTTAALVEKIERLYVRTLEERVRELHETCVGLVQANNRQQDQAYRLQGALDAVLPIDPAVYAPGSAFIQAYRKGADDMRWQILRRVSWGSDLADRIRNEPVPEYEP